MREISRRREPAAAHEQEEPAATRTPAAPHDLLQLQASAGNAAVVRLLREPATAEAAPAAAGGAAVPETEGGDTAQLEADWNNPEYADSQRKFEGGGRPKGSPKERYLKLAPLYKARGIDRPLKWAHENIVQATFFGSETPAHVDLKTALAAAEAELRKDGHNEKPFKKCWAFNPRTTSKGGWSNHADGKAIDIDPENNPHLTNKRQKKIINALTGMDVTAENPGEAQGMTTYEAIAEMSKRFDERFSPEGMEKRIEELEADEERFAAEEAALKAQIGALPKKKRGRLTAEERKQLAEAAKQAKELTKALKAKHAQVERAQERQQLLESERARFAKVDAEAQVQRNKIAELLTEIEEVETKIDALDAQIDAAEEALKDDDDDENLTKEAKKAKRAADKAARAKIRKDRKALEALKKSRKSKHKAIAKAESKIDTLHRWGDEGFMDLEPHLVTALKNAGLSWGGEWAGSKDFMHFEVK
jgi:D-alanyl-D-alanine carboxypeptidase